MNTKLRKRVNTIGKVGKIITIILIVLMFIAEFALLALAITVAIVPENAFQVFVSGEAKVIFDKDIFGSISDQIINGVTQDADVATYEGFGNHVATLTAEEIDGYPVINVHVDEMLVKAGHLVSFVLTFMLNIAGIIVCLFFFKALMNELARADSPFTDGVVQKMRNFAISLLPAAMVSSVSETVITYLFSVGRSLSMSLNLMPVIFALIIFVLAEIFRYGVLLQKESDETL